MLEHETRACIFQASQYCFAQKEQLRVHSRLGHVTKVQKAPLVASKEQRWALASSWLSGVSFLVEEVVLGS